MPREVPKEWDTVTIVSRHETGEHEEDIITGLIMNSNSEVAATLDPDSGQFKVQFGSSAGIHPDFNSQIRKLQNTRGAYVTVQ